MFLSVILGYKVVGHIKYTHTHIMDTLFLGILYANLPKFLGFKKEKINKISRSPQLPVWSSW